MVASSGSRTASGPTDELEKMASVTMHLASKTMEEAAHRVHVEGSRRVGVEGAATDVPWAPSLLQPHVSPDDFENARLYFCPRVIEAPSRAKRWREGVGGDRSIGLEHTEMGTSQSLEAIGRDLSSWAKAPLGPLNRACRE